ncbi:MAG: ABC transporter ATP-binding protein [Gemmatimonadaceae bacterium]|nr:ABC transporter ATP-binding protein [Gemmatimonadaceae bacterium]
MTGVAKFFGPVRANHDASLEVAAGEIHAVVGENGAGKSTLLRVLSGMYAPDAGTVEVFGRDVTGWSTADAIAAGVGMVHQHFMLVPTLTVAENVVLGREPMQGLTYDRAHAESALETLSRESGLACVPSRLVSELSVGEAQRVEILKTLYRGATLLILDEPTAVLSPPEVTELWKVLRTVRDGGATIVLVTHKLDELMDVTDRITVMRRGATVGRMVTRETTPAAIATAMVGREVRLDANGMPTGADGEAVGAAVADANVGTDAGGPPDQTIVATRRDRITGTTPAAIFSTPTPAYTAAPRLHLAAITVAGRSSARAVDALSLSIAPGEILGIAGVEGNGQTELVEAIAGLRPVASGTISVDGTDVTRFPIGKRLAHGITHIPEDRHARGLVLDYSIEDNLILGRQKQYSWSGNIDRARARAFAEDRITAFDIRPADPTAPARSLSGGNQQKIVVAREMPADFRVLLAAQPTRGVDVGAIEFIHDQLRMARRAGKAILLVSAELHEILALSDRVAVMYRGRIVTEMPRAEASEDVLGPWMTGARS